MTPAETLRAIAADPHAARVRQPTAREIIEGRIGRKLPPTADLPPDLKEAVKLLAIHLIKTRQT